MAAATGQTVAVAPDVTVTVTGNADLRPLRILSVDDSPDNQLLIGSFLKRTPHTVLYAAHGLEALGLVQGQDPDGRQPVDLILMDVQMPVMDGYTATRQLRQWEQEQGRLPVPIIAITAHALESDAARSIAAGCNVHLTKPVTRQRLLETIREVMRVAQPGGDDAACV
jgi:CheY-like chemotaxis protein